MSAVGQPVPDLICIPICTLPGLQRIRINGNAIRLVVAQSYHNVMTDMISVENA